MSIYRGTSELLAVYKGGTQLSKIYAGTTQIFPQPFTAYNLEWLVVAGGAPGGYSRTNDDAGGGGAGEFRDSATQGPQSISFAGITIQVVVGAGSTSVTNHQISQNNGNDSYFTYSSTVINSYGGGGGGNYDSSEFYMMIGDDTHGPYTGVEMSSWFTAGDVSPECWCSADGGDWKMAKDFFG